MANRNNVQDEIDSALDIAAQAEAKSGKKFKNRMTAGFFGLASIAGLIWWQIRVNS